MESTFWKAYLFVMHWYISSFKHGWAWESQFYRLRAFLQEPGYHYALHGTIFITHTLATGFWLFCAAKKGISAEIYRVGASMRYTHYQVLTSYLLLLPYFKLLSPRKTYWELLSELVLYDPEGVYITTRYKVMHAIASWKGNWVNPTCGFQWTQTIPVRHLRRLVISNGE